MKVLILTTDTIHHAFFIQKVLERNPDLHVVIESESIKSKYLTAHEFEENRDFYEKERWGNTIKAPFEIDSINKRVFKTVNDAEVVRHVKKIEPEVSIVFGTRKILQDLVDVLPISTFNLHGGDPQLYRGLDSHLWAIWHQDSQGMKVCMHKLNSKLDDGEIYDLRSLNIKNLQHLYQLRAHNTEICVSMVLDLIEQISDGIEIAYSKQKSQGRYYSFMPAVLKSTCVNNFYKMIK